MNQIRTTTEALARLRESLHACSDAQIQDVRLVVRRGARIPPPSEGVAYREPLDLPPDRRAAYWPLAEAVCEQRPIWRPIWIGRWEDVLATLVIERQWERIHAWAEEL